MATFNELRQAAIDARDKSAPGNFQSALDRFIDWIEPYTPAVDVVMQQPAINQVTAIVWAGLRFLIGVSYT
jgi:hypothetical protein